MFTSCAVMRSLDPAFPTLPSTSNERSDHRRHCVGHGRPAKRAPLREHFVEHE
jgi:hypothetical protein